MNSKQLLKEINLLNKRIENKKLFYQQIKNLNGINSQGYEERINNPNINVNSPFLNLLFTEEELEHEIKELEKQLETIKEKASSLIHKLNNDIFRSILFYRYFENKTWDEISMLVYAANSTVRRYHDMAINILNQFKIDSS